MIPHRIELNCVTFAQPHSRDIYVRSAHAQIVRYCCAEGARNRQDVTFGPLCRLVRLLHVPTKQYYGNSQL
jgi:hypothetical protein